MVGREAPLAAADEALSGALSGSGGLLLISGEAGIGKTRLAQAIADRASNRAVPQARGFAVDDQGAPALWPWRRAVRTIASMPALLETGPNTTGMDDPSARFQMFTDVCDQLVTAAEASGLLLVLEDMHWADAASLTLLEQLAQELAWSRLLILVTYRPGDLALDATLSRLVRSSGVTHLSLTGLTPADIDRWLRQQPHGAESSLLAGDPHARTGGNPLLVRLITQALRSAAPGADHVLLDRMMTDRPDVRRLIASRTSILSQPAQRMVDGASVVGEKSPIALLTTVVDAPARDAAAAAAEAIRAGILRETSEIEGGVEFVHALVRDAVYAQLPLTDRAHWHRRCANALQTLDASPAGIIACHWQRADGADAVARCLMWSEKAAAEAEASYAFDEARRFRELALRCATRLGAPDAEVAAMTVKLAECHFAAGNIEASLAACTSASEMASAARRPDLMVTAGLVVQGIGTPDVNRRVRTLCQRALAAIGEEPTAARARLLAHIAAATAEDEGGPLAERRSAEALAAAEKTGDPTAILEAIAARHLAISVPDTVVQRLQLGRRAVEIGDTAQRPLAALWGHLWRVDAALQLGNLAEVDREIAEVDRIATSRRSPLARWHWHRLLAGRCALLGDFPGAREHNREAGVLATRMGDVSLAGMSYAFSSQLAQVRGDVGELPLDFKQILDRAPPIPLVLISGTIASALAGDLSAARASFAGFRDLPQTFPYGTKWAATLGQIGMAAVLLDDAEVAGAVFTALLPTALHYTGDGSGAFYSHGSNAGVLGTLALTAGRVDDAVRLLHDGIAMNARIGARPAAAGARLVLAQALLARSSAAPHDKQGTYSDLSTAQTLVTEATAELRRLDMPGPLARAQVLQKDLAAASTPVLSPRETEIAALVAQSLSNRTIAERLFLSERTVESHIRNILNKLGFASRTEIAVWALSVVSGAR